MQNYKSEHKFSVGDIFIELPWKKHLRPFKPAMLMVTEIGFDTQISRSIVYLIHLHDFHEREYVESQMDTYFKKL